MKHKKTLLGKFIIGGLYLLLAIIVLTVGGILRVPSDLSFTPIDIFFLIIGLYIFGSLDESFVYLKYEK